MLRPDVTSGDAGSSLRGAERTKLLRHLRSEGEQERILRAGDAFWEPGGDVIHYRAADNSAETPARFIATLICPPGQEILTCVSAEELAARAHLRHPRPS